MALPAGWGSCFCISVNSRWKRASWYNFTWFFSYEYLPLCCGITSVGWAKSLFRFFCNILQKPFWPPYCLFITFTHFSISSCSFWFLGTFYIREIVMINFTWLKSSWFIFWACLFFDFACGSIVGCLIVSIWFVSVLHRSVLQCASCSQLLECRSDFCLS